MGRMRAKSLAPLGKVAAQPMDEVTIKLLKTVLCRLSRRMRDP